MAEHWRHLKDALKGLKIEYCPATIASLNGHGLRENSQHYAFAILV
jgi:hypothetical protein